MDVFIFAAVNKLRFQSNKGLLTVEQLFDLPLVDSRGQDSLNSLAMEVNRQLNTLTAGSFVNNESDTPETITLTKKLEILKAVIAHKQEVVLAKRQAAERSSKKAMLEEILVEKETESLKNLSPEEIKKQIDALS